MVPRATGSLVTRLERRFDRWLLLHAPLLWRTGLLRFLVRLAILLLFALLFLQAPVDQPRDFNGIGVRDLWWVFVMGTAVAIGLWIKFILRRSVGEIPLRRHVATIAAVSAGSYLWLVTPSLLVWVEIGNIAAVNITEPMLRSDLELFEKYSQWRCIPPHASVGEAEISELHHALGRYTTVPTSDDFDAEPSESWNSCGEKTSRRLKSWYTVQRAAETAATVRDARRIRAGEPGGNQFSHIRASFYWDLALALALGLLAALLSYPAYVWRRNLRFD